mgnify:CR=1 FL=1
MVAKIVVLLLTKGRVPYTLRAIHSIEANLRYDNFSYYVADGGSLPEEHKQVIALLEDEATVKRFYKEKDRIRLQPENPTMQPIYITKNDPSFQVIGKVKGLMRKF